MEDVFVKPKIEVKHSNSTTGVTSIVLQDESFTLMEPLITILQNHDKIAFAGYKLKHCLDREVVVKLKCKKNYSGEEKDVFREGLETLLCELGTVENFIDEICDPVRQ
jgi:DNA-directed RNA polymerase subunit L